MKRNIITWLMLLGCITIWAQGVKPLPTLHVEGRWLVDKHGNQVVLHGVMDTPNMYFNGWRWGSPWDANPTNYNDAGVSKCLPYFKKLFWAMEQTNCDVFRLHMDPAWTNDESNTATGFTKNAEGKTVDPNGQVVDGEADISHFSETLYRKWLPKLYLELAKEAMNHGLYVVVRPPGVCPHNLKVGDYYQQYLKTVWDIFSKNEYVKEHAGQISIELANEPVSVKNAQNQDDPEALRNFFQPIVNIIRENGFTGIIWVPGSGYQSNYRNYKTNPITGDNIGYAVHDYPGWYNSSDDNPDPSIKIESFHDAVPVVDTNPIFITEVDWSPIKEPKEQDKNADGSLRYNEMGQPVWKNLGTWATGSTSLWGHAYKTMLDYFQNISMTLTHPHDFMDLDALYNQNTITPAFNGNPEACAKACMDWYAEYIKVNNAHPDNEAETGDAYTITSFSSDINPYSLYVGDHRLLSLNAVYADGHKKNVTEYTTFTVNNPSIASVSNGYIEAIGVGETEITATYNAAGASWQTSFSVSVSKVPEYEIEGYTRLTDLSEITAQPFAIVNKKEKKMFFGSTDQHLGFDNAPIVITGKVNDNPINGFMFKAEPVSGQSGCYLLRLLKLDGTEYSVWGGWAPGYLNSQPVTGNCCFILGLDNQNGQDIKNGAVWEIKYEHDLGFTMKNIGTGKYLKDSTPAKYDDAIYMNFYKKGSSSGITTIQREIENDVVYNLQGVKVGSRSELKSLPRGIYIIGGKKVVVK